MKKSARMGKIFLMLSASALYAVELKDPQVSFEAVGRPSFIKIKGEGTKLSHRESQAGEKGVDIFEFDLTDLKTGIDMRDEHLKEKYLQVKQFPKAQLTLDRSQPSHLELNAEKEIVGQLTLHGQSQPVTVKATRKGNKVEAQFEIKLSDFGIEIPEWSGITVADKVKVRTLFEAVLKTPELAR